MAHRERHRPCRAAVRRRPRDRRHAADRAARGRPGGDAGGEGHRPAGAEPLRPDRQGPERDLDRDRRDRHAGPGRLRRCAGASRSGCRSSTAPSNRWRRRRSVARPPSTSRPSGSVWSPPRRADIRPSVLRATDHARRRVARPSSWHRAIPDRQEGVSCDVPPESASDPADRVRPRRHAFAAAASSRAAPARTPGSCRTAGPDSLPPSLAAMARPRAASSTSIPSGACRASPSHAAVV